jgi:hypothetical protein
MELITPLNLAQQLSWVYVLPVVLSAAVSKVVGPIVLLQIGIITIDFQQVIVLEYLD